MDGEVWVHYAQVYVESLRADEQVYPDLAACFAGQSNGLCGAAVPGVLFLTTGLHTGRVPFRAELHDEPPPSGDGWQEIVEVPFQPAGEVVLAEWGGGETWPLELARTPYRVRYCATGVDAGHDLDTRMDADPAPDRYLLQFWPDPDGSPDRVIRQTSEMAAYWHGFARQQPPPPSPEKQAETAAAEERARAQRQREEKNLFREAIDRAFWGEYRPSERMRATGGATLAKLDPDLVGALEAASPETQRRIACWVTRRALGEARLTEMPWIAAALAAMDADDPPPFPFDHDDQLAWSLLSTDEALPRTTVTSLDGATGNISKQFVAFSALLHVRDPDPLKAAVRALLAGVGAFGRDQYMELLDEVRREFPVLKHNRLS
jgi:hypothetical protein